MLVEWERVAVLDGPGKYSGGSDWADCSRQRAQHHRETIYGATLRGVHRVVGRQSNVDEHLLL